MITAASTETKLVTQVEKGPVKVFGFYPIDPPHETGAHRHVTDWKNKLARMTQRARVGRMSEMQQLPTTADVSGKSKYEIACTNCGAIQGYLMAFDDRLNGWCDFHYTQWSDGDYWYGCLTPHVSPIDGTLCLLCCCGQDTRDFRANMSIGQRRASLIEESNQKGRQWGSADAKFVARLVTGTIHPWRKPNKNYA